MDSLVQLLSAWFPMIALLALAMIVLGFLGDSIELEEPRPENRLTSALTNFVFAAIWGALLYYSVPGYSDWLVLGLIILSSLAGLASLYRHLVTRKQAN